jgi:hypothetical protein
VKRVEVLILLPRFNKYKSRSICVAFFLPLLQF